MISRMTVTQESSAGEKKEKAARAHAIPEVSTIKEAIKGRGRGWRTYMEQLSKRPHPRVSHETSARRSSSNKTRPCVKRRGRCFMPPLRQ